MSLSSLGLSAGCEMVRHGSQVGSAKLCNPFWKKEMNICVYKNEQGAGSTPVGVLFATLFFGASLPVLLGSLPPSGPSGVNCTRRREQVVAATYRA